MNKFAKILPALFLLIGLILLARIALPLLVYKLWEINNLGQEAMLVSPVKLTSQISGVSIKNYDNFPAFISDAKRSFLEYQEFYLTVPKLKINQSKVLVESNDLASGLVHLPGSALPGERGNIFVSGHSGERGIFNNLWNLKKGDLIEAKVLGSEFKYQVLGFKVVNPDDLSVVSAPDQQNRYLTLMTCVPPGLNVKRLVVLAKLI